MITWFGSLRLLGLALILWPAALFARTLPEIDIQKGAKVSTRDGVQLNAIIRPRGQKDPLPVIFTPTPYVAETAKDGRTAKITLPHDEYHSSALELSIVKP